VRKEKLGELLRLGDRALNYIRSKLYGTDAPRIRGVHQRGRLRELVEPLPEASMDLGGTAEP
jgi:hypothetical protein